MHLTPRTLLMALTACLLGGLVLGGVSSLASAAMPPAPAPALPSPLGYSEADLGDAEITMPTTSPTVSVPTEPPTQALVSPSASGPTVPIAPPPTSPGTASPRASKDVRSTTKPPVPPSADSSPASRTTPTHSLGVPFDRQSGSRAVARPRTLDGWKPPVLHVGTNDVVTPRLSTGGTVAITVMCSPSSACSLGGGTLEIGTDARAVTVTWSSVRSTRSAGWSASSRL